MVRATRLPSSIRLAQMTDAGAHCIEGRAGNVSIAHRAAPNRSGTFWRLRQKRSSPASASSRYLSRPSNFVLHHAEETRTVHFVVALEGEVEPALRSRRLDADAGS